MIYLYFAGAIFSFILVFRIYYFDLAVEEGLTKLDSFLLTMLVALGVYHILLGLFVLARYALGTIAGLV